MSVRKKRVTVNLEPDLHKALLVKSVETSRSISALVNDAVRASIGEETQDFVVFEDRANEPLISYDEMVTRLRKDKRI